MRIHDRPNPAALAPTGVVNMAMAIRQDAALKVSNAMSRGAITQLGGGAGSPVRDP